MIYDVKFNLLTKVGAEEVDCMYCIRQYKEIGYQVICVRRDTKETIFNKAFKRELEKGSGRKAFAKLRDFAVNRVTKHFQKEIF